MATWTTKTNHNKTKQTKEHNTEQNTTGYNPTGEKKSKVGRGKEKGRTRPWEWRKIPTNVEYTN